MRLSRCCLPWGLTTGAAAEAWDAVVTCFFLDTAANALQYVETIHRILRPGGVWVNMGAFARQPARPSPR